MNCCNWCPKHNNCGRQWVMGQKNMGQSCCAECPEYYVCLQENRLARWEIIHPDMVIPLANKAC
ncbi:MAG: hypothetical protein QME81_14345 [bacterium]|nr:hypothetical protein [bacterium]